jgi:hypothetical protein
MMNINTESYNTLDTRDLSENRVHRSIHTVFADPVQSEGSLQRHDIYYTRQRFICFSTVKNERSSASEANHML